MVSVDRSGQEESGGKGREGIQRDVYARQSLVVICLCVVQRSAVQCGAVRCVALLVVVVARGKRRCCVFTSFSPPRVPEQNKRRDSGTNQ